MDCGVLIYDLTTQGVNAGGSGCGCCASVLGGHILKGLEDGVWRRVLFAATGALMSPTSSQQGESIPGICHALVLEREA
jgi:stage V sporulation protein AD